MSPADDVKRSLWEFVPVVVTGCAGLIVFHRATVLSGFDIVQADVGDSRLVVFLLEHWNRVLTWNAEWSSPSMFYPVKGVLGYSDMLFGVGALFTVFRTVGLDLFQAANATMVLLSLLSYASAYWLLHRVLRCNLFGSIIGALFFVFAYPKFAQLPHLQLRFDFFQPLAIGAIAPLFLEERAMGQRELAAKTSVFVGLVCLGASTAFYQAWFFALFVGLLGLVALAHPALRAVIVRRSWEARRILWIPVLLSAAMLAPFLIVYLPALRLGGQRDWEHVLSYLPTPSSYLWLGPEHFLWGRLPFNAADGIAYPIENHLGFGVAVTCLVLAGWAWAIGHFVSALRRRNQSLTLPPVLLAVTLVSSLIVTALTVRLGAFSPWQAVYEFVPGASVIVGVGRWVLTLTLPVSILLAAGADWIQQRSQGHAVLSQVVLLAAAAFIAVEQIGRIPAVYSGEVAFRYHQKLSKVIPASCEAFLLAPPLRFDKLPVVTRQDFDEAKYLAANPDVAQAWPGGAWDHFSQFGYREGRVLDKETNLRARPPEDDPAQIFFNFHYHLSAMIASAISGRPTVNGASGLGPADYTVANLYQRDLAGQLGTWMNGYPGKGACVVSEEIEPYSLTDLGPRSAFLGVPLME